MHNRNHIPIDRSRRLASRFFIIAVSVMLLGMHHVHSLVPRPQPPVAALTVPPDEGGVVMGSQSGVFLLTSETDSSRVIETSLDHVHHLAFSPDGALLAVAGGSPAEWGTVELWSWHDRKRVRVLEGHDDLVYSAAWLDGAKKLVTAAGDRTLRVWDTTTGQMQLTLTGHSGPVLCLAVSPDGRLVCSGSADQTIRVWDTETWKPLRSLTNHVGPVTALTFMTPSVDPTGNKLSYLASASGDATVRIWQPETGRMVRIVRQPSPLLAIARHSQWTLLTGSKDGRVRTINGESGELLAEEQVGTGWVTNIAVARQRNQVWVGDSHGRLRMLQK